MENIEWIDFNEVKNKLTYPSDKKVWDEARQIIKKIRAMVILNYCTS